MRTNIVLNDELMAEARRFSRARSKRELVEEALRTFVEVKAAERRRATYLERLHALDERLRDVRLRDSPADLLRADRDRR
jgi:Arc/MetJ family transcription regulator